MILDVVPVIPPDCGAVPPDGGGSRRASQRPITAGHQPQQPAAEADPAPAPEVILRKRKAHVQERAALFDNAAAPSIRGRGNGP